MNPRMRVLHWGFRCSPLPTFRRCLCSSSPAPSSAPSEKQTKSKKVAKKKETKANLRKRTQQLWLDSLTLPSISEQDQPEDPDELMCIGNLSPPSEANSSSTIIGIDPDFNGAIAVLRTENDQVLAEVFDAPSIKVLVAGHLTVRPDARSIFNLLQTLNVPRGTQAYIESSRPFSTDGKKSWWASGFGSGLWIGLLMAAGICVKPVRPIEWKRAFGISFKDESRARASMLFPSVVTRLQRKKDHGRADALLIAAFGKGMRTEPSAKARDSETLESSDSDEAILPL